MLKTCTRCHVEKETTEFYVHPDRRPRKSGKNGPIGFSAWCKRCYCDKNKEWLKKNYDDKRRIQWRATWKAKEQRYRDEVFAAYGGYVCKCCGENEPKFLTLDHIGNDGGKWRREIFGTHSAAGLVTYRWLRKNHFPPGFQVLCMNCNWGKRLNGICPHEARRNDYPHVGVGSSDSKRTASILVN